MSLPNPVVVVLQEIFLNEDHRPLQYQELRKALRGKGISDRDALEILRGIRAQAYPGFRAARSHNQVLYYEEGYDGKLPFGWRPLAREDLPTATERTPEAPTATEGPVAGADAPRAPTRPSRVETPWEAHYRDFWDAFVGNRAKTCERIYFLCLNEASVLGDAIPPELRPVAFFERGPAGPGAIVRLPWAAKWLYAMARWSREVENGRDR
jgi:hypothetical protein